MKLARWHLWAVGLALILLVGLWFIPGHEPEPTSHQSDAESDALQDHTPWTIPTVKDDCVSCPDTQCTSTYSRESGGIPIQMGGSIAWGSKGSGGSIREC